MWGLLIQAAGHWLDCELLKASVLKRLGEREKMEGGCWNSLPGERGHSCLVTTSHVRTLSSLSVCSLGFVWHRSLSISVWHSVPVFVFPLAPSMFTEATVFPRGFLPLLRWPLQALQWLLCQPHQGPEGPGERYYINAWRIHNSLHTLLLHVLVIFFSVFMIS